MEGLLTIEDVLKRIRIEAYEQGSQKDAAIHYGVSEQYLSDVLNGKREPGKKLLDGMGLSRITYYQAFYED